MDENITVNRTPELIAAEINSIKDQTRTMILCNSIEIGRRLVEAKNLLPHGEWGKWLETSVEYSQSTANNLMRIFEEYGAGQFSLFGDHQAKSQALAKLSYTQAVALLAIPEVEREAFIEENDVENMSTRELQQAIKEKQELEEKLKAEEEHSKTISESYKRLEKVNKEHYEEATRLEKELKDIKEQLEKANDAGNDEEVEKLQESLKKTAGDLDEANRKIVELETQLKEQPIDIPAAVVKIPEEVQQELDTLRKTAGNKTIVEFSVKFDTLVKGFKDLLDTLWQLKESAPEQYEQYKGAVLGLISKMMERLG